MFPLFAVLIQAFLIHANAAAAAKPHLITFGKWTTVQCCLDSAVSTEGNKPLTLKVRPLLIDAHVKEFTLGLPHDVTDRLFVVRRVFRINESLPQESASLPHWQWERGGWLLVDRITGRISAINLPDFDALYSVASWYRDYVAYCGVSEDGKKIYAVVSQIARRKPVLKKVFESATNGIKDAPTDPCPAPTWQRSPSRVTFEPAGTPKQTFAIRGHTVDLVTPEEDDEEASR
jgi:hypothetical protein